MRKNIWISVALKNLIIDNMELSLYLDYKNKVISAGFADEIAWSQNVKAPETVNVFIWEYVWIVICSGMKYTVARKIEDKVIRALRHGQRIYPVDKTVFGHALKCEAIQKAWDRQHEYFGKFQRVKDDPKAVMEFITTLPYTRGPIIRWHFAKNLGLDVAKPDRHLQRIADFYDTTPQALCEKMSKESGDRIATVDMVLWRAAEQGFINTLLIGDK
ncbi:MAG: hypothetical protein ACLP51_05790 [Syntrophobacteraceae bacterium]